MPCIGESDVWYGMYVWNGIIPYVCMVWYGMYGMSTGGFAAPDRSTEGVFRKSALEDLLKSKKNDKADLGRPEMEPKATNNR